VLHGHEQYAGCGAAVGCVVALYPIERVYFVFWEWQKIKCPPKAKVKEKKCKDGFDQSSELDGQNSFSSQIYFKPIKMLHPPRRLF
jgi:hypothetical protein